MRQTLIIFAGILMCIAMTLTSCQDMSSEEIEERIRTSEALTRVDNLCNGLPKPMNFQFVSKKLSGNSFTVSLSYRYQSSLTYEEVEEFYAEYFGSNGWQMGNSSGYEKGRLQIAILPVSFPGAKYSIHCSEVNR